MQQAPKDLMNLAGVTGNPGFASAKHLPQLDGIRGLAILSVLIFHATVYFESGEGASRWAMELFKAGWVGVDLFFVLSCFLITGILLDTRKNTKFYGVFFARRFLRIAPLYFLVLGIVFGVLPLFVSFSTPSLIFLRENQWWFWTYLPNWGFVYHRRAFGNADWLWLDHFWSLAVEEQFYLFWPIVVRTFKTLPLIAFCIFLAVASLFTRIALSQLGMNPGALYFPTPCRLDGLALGSIVAVLSRSHYDLRSLYTKLTYIAFAAMTTIASIFVLREGFRFSDPVCLTIGIFAVSVLATCLIARITLLQEGNNLDLFNLKILRVLGKYSYGTYVLHHLFLPLMLVHFSPQVFSQWTDSDIGSKLATIVTITSLSVGLGYVSWHIWEKWFMKLKRYFSYATPA